MGGMIMKWSDKIEDLHQYNQVNVLNVRTLYMAMSDKNYRKVLLDGISYADGRPVFWLARKWLGIKLAISGPDILEYLLNKYPKSSEVKTVGLYGEVAEKINTLSGWDNIELPFVESWDHFSLDWLSGIEKDSILLLAVGSPKQDYLGSSILTIRPDLKVIKLGAAFAHAVGEIKDSNDLIKKLGLRGVYWRFRERPLSFLRLYPKYLIFIAYVWFIPSFYFRKDSLPNN